MRLGPGPCPKGDKGPKAVDCYCVCHYSVSSRAYCEHCFGNNSVGRYWRDKNIDSALGSVKIEYPDLEISPEVNAIMDKYRNFEITGKQLRNEVLKEVKKRLKTTDN